MKRRTLALSFIVTTAAAGGCRTNNPPPPEPPKTPAPPKKAPIDPDVPICPKGIEEDAPCDAPAVDGKNARCQIAGAWSGCGLNGYECRDGKWDELMTFCNPPRPDDD